MKTIVLAITVLVTIYCLLFTIDLLRADITFNSGESFSRYGFYERAAEEYREAIVLNPREPRYHRELAYTLTKLQKVKEAEREAETSYHLNPKNSLTVRSLISTYVELADIDPQYLTRAEKLIAAATAQQPTNPELYYQQALIFFKGKKEEEAVVALQKSLELKPDYQKPRELLEVSQ